LRNGIKVFIIIAVCVLSALIPGFCGTEPGALIPFEAGRIYEYGTGSGKFGYMDSKGNTVIEPQFTDADGFVGGVAPVEFYGKWGLIDQSGKYILKPKYDKIFYFEDGVACVELNKKYGAIDISGREIIKPEYINYINFEGGMAQICVNGKVGFVDKTGKVAIAPQYDRVLDFYNDIALVTIGSKEKFIDKTGKEVLDPKFGDYGVYFKGFITNDKDDDIITCYNADKTKKYRISRDVTFYEGLASVKDIDSGKFGYINTDGIMVIEPQFAAADNFSEGYAVVKAAFNWKSYIDKSGKGAFGRIILDAEEYADLHSLEDISAFEDPEAFHNGLARVGGDKYIDKEGKVVIQAKGQIKMLTAEYFLDEFRHHSGLMDSSGKYLIEPKYNVLLYRGGDVFEYRIGREYGYMDSRGNILKKFQLVYED